MIMKLGIEHNVLKLYHVNINEDLELTLTYFTTMPNFCETFFCTYSRLRYQVSVYRTIGPLVPMQDGEGEGTISRVVGSV